MFNGYPLIYPDTGQYLIDSFTLDVPVFRTVFYPVFMRFTSFGITPWLVIVAQSAITVFVIGQCIVYLVERDASSNARVYLLLAVVLCLGCATTLPWYVGQLMPDLFSGLLILCLFLLLYDVRLTTAKSIVLALLLAISVASHLTHLLLACIVLVGIGVLGAFRRTRHFWPARTKKQVLVFVLVPIMASSMAVAASNWRAGWGFTLSAGGRMFLVARLFASGLAGSYLQQECKVEKLNVCGYLDSLPTNENRFLWGGNPVFQAMGGWTNSKREATRIIRGTIEHRPGAFLWECMKQMARQFVRIEPGDGNVSEKLFPFLVPDFQSYYPGEVPKLQAAEQWNGGLEKLAQRVGRIDVAVFWLSIAGCLFFAGSRQWHTHPSTKLFIFVLLALLANALVTGSLSNVMDRYQSRVSWLMPLCCLVYVISVFRNNQRRNRAIAPAAAAGK